MFDVVSPAMVCVAGNQGVSSECGEGSAMAHWSRELQIVGAKLEALVRLCRD